MKRILVSACLLGLCCRYDGGTKPCEKVLALAKDNILVPVCPEQLGGLSTPRTPSERQPVGGVLSKDGRDVSENYARGAEAALKIARLAEVDYAILKARSPACGKGEIYDGSFSGKTTAGNGVAAELLMSEGIAVFSDEEI